MISEKIVIKAQPELIFEAIRKLRDRKEDGRSLKSYDGTTAVVEEHLTNVPLYGTVDCVWQETEIPFQKIDFKMVSSTKFKESHGSWLLTPSSDGTTTTLELKVHMDAGLSIPFAAELTKSSTSKDSKERLALVKKVAEEITVNS